MKLTYKLCSAAVVLAGLTGVAHAENFEAFTAPGFTTETTNLPGYYFVPLVSAGDTITSFSVLSTTPGFSATAMIDFASPQTSYSFLWGSPDAFNTVSDGATTVTGSGLTSGVYTFSDTAGFSSLTFASTGVAFELAQVAPIPEPGTWALVLAGLAAVGVASRSRKRG